MYKKFMQTAFSLHFTLDFIKLVKIYPVEAVERTTYISFKYVIRSVWLHVCVGINLIIVLQRKHKTA
jgi:hypothetical protein